MKFSRRDFLKTGVALSFSSYGSYSVAASCRGSRATVFVGGVTGFNSLANPGNTKLLRQTCRVGLYIHRYIWTKTPPDVNRAILSAFSGESMNVELDIVKNPEEWFRTDYRRIYTDVGVKTKHVHVNGFDAQHLDIWRRFVSAGKSCGLETIAPIFSPNRHQFENAPFELPSWDYLRDGAKLGGALTTDAPPQFFWEQPRDYRRFIVDELRWANNEGLESTFIVSPRSSGNNFLRDTQETVDFLDRSGAMPNKWIVENYDPKAALSYPNRIGSEDEGQTILGVALWLAKNVN